MSSTARFLAFAAAVLLPACGGGGGGGTPVPTLQPDFMLDRVNPTGGAPVSPRQYLGNVSAYYFGHAT